MTFTYRGQTYTATSQMLPTEITRTYRGIEYSHTPSQAVTPTPVLTYRGIRSQQQSQALGNAAFV